MAIKNDYLLDMIARFVESIVTAFGRARDGQVEDARVAYEGIVGDVLDMDPDTALSLAPESLSMMMQISAVDESLAVYAVYALERAASSYDEACDPTGSLRHAQAQAIASTYGFEVTEVPVEVQEALL